jgi:hypothetical protein
MTYVSIHTEPPTDTTALVLIPGLTNFEKKIGLGFRV